jgi:NADH-ubiquinone oxidoreductase chain 5
MYLTILSLPLIGSLLSGLLGRKLGRLGTQIITVSLMGITVILVNICYYEVVLCKSPLIIHLSEWLNVGLIGLEWSFIFDDLTLSMMIPISYISFLVHLYSIGYMADDPHVQRFFSYLSLFTFFMLIMVSAENWLILFVGWEGVGLVSYLLIGFWFTRIEANRSALKAFFMNRIGDTCLFLAMVLALWLIGDLSFTTLFSLLPYIHEDYIGIIGLLILIAVIAKSGQLGLHAWLPSAMEGPTPVSALIHAATMVTAGIYLLLRFSPLYGYSYTLIWLGGLTALFGAVYAYVQTDLKRIIAYSTTSQLGYMVLACGLGQYGLALAHLINHAFFKGLLFLSAGIIIHAVNDEQDIRKMGGLVKLLPITYITTLIGSLSLIALPFLTGFYSKEVILHLSVGTIGYALALLAAIFTAIYSIKLIYYVFIFPPQSKICLMAKEPGFTLLIPTIILSFLSIFGGYFTHVVELDSLFIHPNNFISIDHLPGWIGFLPFIAFFLAPFLVPFKVNIPTLKIELFRILKLGQIISRYLDYGFMGWIGPYGSVLFINKLAAKLDLLSTRYLLHFSIYPLLFLMLFSF